MADGDFNFFRFAVLDKDFPEGRVRVEEDEEVEGRQDVVHEVLKRKYLDLLLLNLKSRSLDLSFQHIIR